MAAKAFDGTAHTIRDLDELAAVRREWNEVVHAAPVQTPDALWEWVYPWSQVYASDGSLRCIIVKDAGGRAIGVAPLCISREGNRWLQRDHLTLIGGYGRAWSTGLEIAACPGQETTVARLVLNEALAWSADWRAISLLRMRVNARIIPALVVEAAQLGLGAHVELFGRCCGGPLPEDIRTFDEEMPSSRKRTALRSCRKRLMEDFECVEFTDCAHSAEVREWAELMKEFDMASRRQRGMSHSNYADPRWLRWFIDSSRRLHEVGVVRLKRLAINGKPVAFGLYAVFEGTLYWVQSAYDLKFSRWQVGLVLLRECISEGISDGVTRVDLLPGEHRYKTEIYGGREQLLNLHLLLRGASLAAARLAARFVRTGIRKTAKSFLLRR